ncbi:MAG: amidohydrolase [Myxococcales bacterium]|nr:amidohydrolase [Myxococcales bacterium]
MTPRPDCPGEVPVDDKAESGAPGSGKGRRWPRRVAMVGGGLLLASAILPWLLVDRIGGAATQRPLALHTQLSPAGRALLAKAMQGLDATRRLDMHVHLAGLGTGSTGTWVNPHMTAWTHPINRLKFSIYLSAAGVTDPTQADQQYLARLFDVVRAQSGRGRHLLLAFDYRHLKDGRRDVEHSEFYVPNDRVVALARQHPEMFVAAGSVHPYRKDALAELDRLAAAGVRAIKWLPNAQAMDPGDPRCDAFYDKMAAHGMVLLTHTGKELAVEAEADQDFGNPLRLRRPLDHGVLVIAAHMASLGDDEDFDAPASATGRPRVPSWQLLLRLLDEKRYVGRLFGEVSALTMFSRCKEPLLAVLARPDLFERLVDGSDYPLPAVNALYQTRQLASLGYVTDSEGEALRDIYAFNPLLFDLVLKRTLRHPTTGAQLPASVFHDRFGLLEPNLLQAPPAPMAGRPVP